jgi:cephalosporin hydroxylase
MVLGIDIDIRKHNREAIESHPFAYRIKMLEGSSIDEDIANQVKGYATNFMSVMVCFDSNHTHNHVLQELELYAELVSIGNYCIVWDTAIEDANMSFPNRPWGKGNSPKTAVHEFLTKNTKFEIDKSIQNKLLITSAPGGFLRRIK